MYNMSYKVTIYHAQQNTNDVSWYVDRVEGATYKTSSNYNRLLFEARLLMNATQIQFETAYSVYFNNIEGDRHPILVNDVVRIETLHRPHGVPAEYYLRTETDWLKFEEDVIQLLKHFR